MGKKVSELNGAELDYWVARAEGLKKEWTNYVAYSTSWSQGGPIIEREGIQIGPGRDVDGWTAYKVVCNLRQDGPTPLIAAMRCYVASKFGDEVPGGM